jgi:dihydropteroate synthase
MGVLNVTPDSFSDGGRWASTAEAVAHGLVLVQEGADVIDVGGESTRPGAEPVDPVEERRRILPVIEALAPSVRVSVDTRNADTAEAAIHAGASLVNDVSARLWPVAAAAGVGWVAVHCQGDPTTMQVAPHYDDVVAEVEAFLVAKAEEALAGGVDEVWIDPGIGFGKTATHNLALLAGLDRLVDTGHPVCIGTSRKAFLGRLAARSDHGASRPGLPGLDAPLALDDVRPVATDDRIEGSLSTATWALLQGAAMVRVHDVRPTVHAVALVGAR